MGAMEFVVSNEFVPHRANYHGNYELGVFKADRFLQFPPEDENMPLQGFSERYAPSCADDFRADRKSRPWINRIEPSPGNAKACEVLWRLSGGRRIGQ